MPIINAVPFIITYQYNEKECSDTLIIELILYPDYKSGYREINLTRASFVSQLPVKINSR